MPIIVNQSEIDTLVERFRNALCIHFPATVTTKVGHPSGSWEQDVMWSDRLKMWMAYSDESDEINKKYFTIFGLSDPFSSKSNPINAEINFPSSLSERPANIQCAFYRLPDGKTLIVHRGCINIGHDRMKSKDFMTKYEDYGGKNILLASPKGRPEKKLAIIAELSSPDFTDKIIKYVNIIKKIKDCLR